MTADIARRLALAAACGACACAPEPAWLASEQAAITGGAPDTTHPASAALVAVSPLCGALAPPPVAFCSGTLIAPRVVLTAAHCLDEAQPTTTRVVFGASIDAPVAGGVAQPVAAVIHPGYMNGVDDVALLVLDAPVAIAPVALASAALGDADVGRTVTVVGHGLDDPGPGGVTGVRRSGTATISAVSAAQFAIVAAPAMSCGGDSGGPVLIDEGGAEVIAGVTSTGGPSCQSGSNERVDAFRDFIDPVVDEVAASPPAARPPVELAVDYCAAGCDEDADCPATMACAARADGTRSCGLGGLPPGSFGASCVEACEGGTCVTTADGCRCWVPCDAGPAPGDDCACAVGRARRGKGGQLLWLVLLLGLAITRERMTR